MNVPVSGAKARLTDLVRRAEAGEDVVLTRRGRPAVRLTPVKPPRDPAAFKVAVDEIVASARAAAPGSRSCAARSADFLYDEDGLPG